LFLFGVTKDLCLFGFSFGLSLSFTHQSDLSHEGNLLKKFFISILRFDRILKTTAC
jgi:surfactin synthase thioesterase subunit